MKFTAPHTAKRRARFNSLIKFLFSPPLFEDVQKGLLARTLHFLLLIGILLCGSYVILTLFVSSEPSGTILSGSMMLISGFLLILLHKKQIKLVSAVLVISAYLSIMSTLIVNGGIRDEAALVLIALLSIAGFLLGMRVVIPLGAITAVLLTALFFAERQKLIPEDEHFFSVGVDELVLSLIAVFVTTIILYQVAKQIIENNEAINAQAHFLSEKNRQLEKTQTELIAAKEQAEEANRSRSVFFSRLSHDLRTPLNSILGLAAHLRLDDDQIKTADRKELAAGIDRSGRHLLDLINNLLDISRLEAHQLQLHIHPTPLHTVLLDVIMMLRVTAEDKGLDLRLQIGEGVPETVFVDEQRLQQILINLLGNGLKFTERGEVLLNVSLDPRETAVTAICFEVIDTGCGMDSQDLEKVFEPFVQGANNKSLATGTGLGLAISRQLVEAMGSTLQVESHPGQGSRFWFSLPLQQKSSEPKPEPIKV